MRCPACGCELSQVSFRSVCPKCGRALHSCAMCAFHDPNAYHGCREGVDENVAYKDESNFCDSFRLAEGSVCAGADGASKAKASRDALKALFGD